MALPTFTMRELLEAGVHFGHHVRRWNPKMEPYLYGERSQIHIIDLSQTVPMLYRALDALRKAAAEGQRILFVGSKRQASGILAETATQCGQYYINHRWLGGTLTNWQTVSRSINCLLEMEKDQEEGTFGDKTKRERLSQERRYKKLQRSLGGIKSMGGVPSMLFIIDTNKESTAVAEAVKLGLPVVAIVDSNSNPDHITWPVPGNDDSRRSIALYCRLAAQAILEGLRQEASNFEKSDDGPKDQPGGERAPSGKGDRTAPSKRDRGKSGMKQAIDAAIPKAEKKTDVPVHAPVPMPVMEAAAKKMADAGVTPKAGKDDGSDARADAPDRNPAVSDEKGQS